MLSRPLHNLNISLNVLAFLPVNRHMVFTVIDGRINKKLKLLRGGKGNMVEYCSPRPVCFINHVTSILTKKKNKRMPDCPVELHVDDNWLTLIRR